MDNSDYMQHAKKMKTYHEYGDMLEDMIEYEIENLKMKVEIEVDIVKDDIDTRIESMKARLDDLREEIFTKLDAEKEKMIDDVFIELNTVQLNDQIRLQEERLKKLKTFDVGVRLKIDDYFDDEAEHLIGEIYFNYKATLLNRIPYGQPECFELNTDIVDILEHKSRNFLIHTQENTVVLHDENFNFIRELRKEDQTNCQISGVSVDKNFNVYIIDDHNDTISKFDENFNLIVSAKRRRKYRSLCNFGDTLYCYRKAQDSIYNVSASSLKILNYLMFNHYIDSIKVFNDIACIRHDRDVYFYKLPTFEHIFKESNANTGVVFRNQIYTCFCTNHENDDRPFIHVYDKNGGLVNSLLFTVKKYYGQKMYFSVAHNNVLFYNGKSIRKLKLQN